MKTGMDDRRQTLAAFGLLLVALVLIGRWVVDSGAPERSERKTTLAVGTSVERAHHRRSASLDPMLRLDGLKVTEALPYEGSGRDIFRVVLDVPVPDPRPRHQEQIPDPPKLTTVAPFPLTFFGFSRREGKSSIFLLKGEDVFVAREGDIVDRRYKIVKVMANAVDVEDLLSNQRQQLRLVHG